MSEAAGRAGIRQFGTTIHEPDLGAAQRELHPIRVMTLVKADNYGFSYGTELEEAAMPADVTQTPVPAGPLKTTPTPVPLP